MPNCSKNEVILVRYPFSDLTSAKVRPAVVVGAFAHSPDYLIVPLTSRVGSLAVGEFLLGDWKAAGLNLPSAVKRGVYTVHDSLILKLLGNLATADAKQIEQSFCLWLELP
ncbi:MAG: type II toxin-antitoxin system PemK/MazF family toxin [Pirellulales bacterium]